MDITKSIRQNGLFATAQSVANHGKHNNITSIPLPNGNIETETEKIAEWLLSFDKKKIMLFTPETALIEAMSKKATEDTEFIIVVPFDMSSEEDKLIRERLPIDSNITIIREPSFPRAFYPGNGLMVICGYSFNGKAMVTLETYRLIEHYKMFVGKKAWVEYANDSTPYDGWIQISENRFNAKWDAK